MQHAHTFEIPHTNANATKLNQFLTGGFSVNVARFTNANGLQRMFYVVAGDCLSADMFAKVFPTHRENVVNYLDN